MTKPQTKPIIAVYYVRRSV